MKSKAFSVSFNLGEYDKSKELIIDPILAYGSYLGGTAFDEARAITVDAQGNAYVVGTSASLNFPTTAGTIKPAMLPSTNNQYWYDAFVTKVNPAGTALVFSTYFGGRSGNETGSGVAVDAGGNVLLSGTTMANDLPTVNAYQTTFGGTDDAFAAKLNSNGSAIIYSTYLGGNNTDLGGKIALNRATGDAVFAGFASSGNFPTTPGAYKPKLCDNTPGSCNGIFYSGSYVVKLTATGSAVYSTLFDMGVNDVALDASDNATLGGTAGAVPATAGAYQTASSGGIEGFIAKLNPSGNSLVYGTFLGGGLQSDRINSIAIDTAGSIYATGQTQNTAFPTTAGAFDQTYNGNEDGFVTKFNPAGSMLVYSTFLGGAAKDQPFGLALGTDNSAFVAGETLSSTTFPLKNSINGANGSIFLTHLNADASALVYSSLLGVGGAYDVAVDGADGAYITGHTTSVVVTPDSFQPMKGEATSTSSAKDAFVIKLAPSDENIQTYNISGSVTDPTQFGNYQPIIVTVTGTVQRSVILPYGNGSGVIPYFFGSLPAGGNYTVTARKTGFEVLPESVTFNNLGANQFADFTVQPNQKPQSVITSPAHGTTFNAPATINITATASDPDGDAITKVDFVAYSSATGNINLGTDLSAPYEFSWTNVPVGTWSLAAYPTDSKGLRGDSAPTVHVFVVDPTGANVSITGPTEGQAFTQGGYVPISVGVSSSVNLVEVRDQNNNLVGRMTNSPWTTQWRVMNVGSYTLTATAFTQTGQQATSVPVHITVNPLNHRITGRITDSVTNSGIAGVTLNLTSPTNPSITAQTTTDSSGSYLFTGLGATPDDGVLITPSLSNYTFAPPTINIGYLGYIDWENESFVATSQTQISVALTSPANGQIFTAPAAINLAANASSGAGTITKVEFLRRNPNGTTAVLATDMTAPFEHQLTDVGVGNYTYLARATDSTNAVAESDDVSVTVRLATVSLSGRITNQAGNGVANVEVYVAGAIAWSVPTDASGNFIFTNLPGGGNYYITPQPANTITFTPVSRSYTNVTSNITGIDFVASEPNQSPSPQFIAPVNGGVYSLSQPIPLHVLANDPDNNVTHFSVIANNGSSAPTIAQTTRSEINTLWQPAAPGNYTLTAVVRDGGPVQTTVSISITVTPPAPVSIAGRIVDRNSVGIEGVTLELKDYPQEETVVGTATTDANGNYTIANVTTFVSYSLKASKQDYTFSPQKRTYFNLAASQTNADFTGTLQLQPSDFDGDGMSDIAVWRPSNGVWHLQRSSDNSYNALQFGGAQFGDVAVPGNYDGDKKTDYAVYRAGIWYIRQSSNGQVRTAQFGLANDKPVAGDYDGDGKTDLAVWRPSDGVWYIQRSSDGGYDFRQFGLNGDTPLAGDYDGDGKTDLTIWRGSTGVWFVQQSSDGNYRAYQFGTGGDVPLVGDFDGDKMADYTIFRPSTGVWYVNLSSNGGFKILQWGNSTDIPVPGDFDRDSKTDFGVFRPAEGNWYVFKSSTNSYIIQHFGANGDLPVPAAYR
ncbi:MAG TPA: Ig-like domain-containing protein [Pyrinomonadaceae bacterium]|nr:Ig-like domain-containing protein [Pyrinomonadaceae bacterium]